MTGNALRFLKIKMITEVGWIFDIMPINIG